MQFVDGWYIPDRDPNLETNKNPIRQQSANDIKVIPKALRYTVGRSCVIQAGCRVGLWPATLAKHFAHVETFEPETRNYECAVKNLESIPNVKLHKAALGRAPSTMWLEYSRHASGSHQVVTDSRSPGHECEVMTIDSLGLAPDAIFLDIEGFEMYALIGGEETVAKNKPVLVLEENHSADRYGIKKGSLAKWLAKYGYRVVDRQYRDYIFVA